VDEQPQGPLFYVQGRREKRFIHNGATHLPNCTAAHHLDRCAAEKLSTPTSYT
jgi:hypothetical protein